MSLSVSARSTDIRFKSNAGTSHDAVRLFLVDGRWFDVYCQPGSSNGLLLRVADLPGNIKDDIVSRLTSGEGHHEAVPEEAASELSFLLDRRLKIGGKPLLHAKLGERFLRVFILSEEVIDAHYVHTHVTAHA